jgi:hypothetical protein
MRAGSLAGAVWLRGKPTCHCAQPDDPGHGAGLRLTYKWRGKTINQAWPTPAALRKAEQEIAEFRNYQQLSREPVDAREQVCRLRPVEETLTPEEKNGRIDSPGNRARSRPVPACGFPGSSQSWPAGSGGRRNGRAFGHASCRFDRLEGTAELPSSSARTATPAVWLRPADSLSGTALQTGPDSGGVGGGAAAVLAELRFHGAVQIVDLYHACRHLWQSVRKLHPNDEVKQKARMRTHQKQVLDKVKIEKLATAMTAPLPQSRSG